MNTRDRKLAKEVADQLLAMDRRISAAGTPQLAYSSIEDGALREYDAEGTLGATIGQQFDGSHTITTHTGKTPPKPEAPETSPGIHALTVRWSGKFASGAVSPMDFKHAAIHVSTVANFTPGPDTQRASVRSELGDASTIILDPGTYYVALEAWTLAGKRSPLSGVVEATVLDVPVDAVMQARLEAAEADVVELETVTIPALDEDLTAAEGRLTTAEGKLSTIETVDLPALRTDLSTLDGELTTAEGRITAAEGKISTAEGELSTLQTVTIPDLDADLDAVAGRVNTAEGKLSTIETVDLPALRGDLSTLDGELTTAEGRITTAEGKLSTIETTDLPALRADLSTLDGELTTAEGRITTAEADVATKVPLVAGVSGSKTYRDLLHYWKSGANITGSLVVRTDIAITSGTMARIRYEGAELGNGESAGEISFYAYSLNGGTIHSPKATSSGSRRIGVRLARSADDTIALIFDPISPADWDYIRFTIPEVQIGYTTAVTSPANWTGAITTDLTDLTQITVPVMRDLDDTHELAQGWRATGTVEIDGGKLTADSVTALQILAKTITAGEIATGTLTSASGVFGTLDASVINAGTLSTARLNAGDLRAHVLSAGKITAGDMVTGTLTATSAVIASLDASKLTVGTVAADRLDAATIRAKFLAAGKITASDIVTGTLTSASGVFGTMDASVINAGTVSTARLDAADLRAHVLSAGKITAGDMVTGTLTATSGVIASLDASKLTAGTVAADRLDASTIRAKFLAAGKITASDIVAGSLTSASGVFGTVDASVINAGTLSTARLNAGDLRAHVLSAGKITAGDIVSGTLTSASGVFGELDASVINVGILDAARIGARTITAEKVVLGTGDNLLRNADFAEDGAGWSRSSGITFYPDGGVNGTASVLIPASTSLVGSYLGSDDPTYRLDADPGGTYRVAAWVWSATEIPAGAVRVYGRAYSRATGAWAFTSPTHAENAEAVPASTWTKVEGLVTIPADRDQLVVGLYKTSSMADAVRWSLPSTTHAADASLIVKGSITADELSADAIEGKTLKLWNSGGVQTVQLDGLNNFIAGELRTSAPGAGGVVLTNNTSGGGEPGIWFAIDGEAGSEHAAIYSDSSWDLTLRGKSGATGAGAINVEGGLRLVTGGIGDGAGNWMVDESGHGSFMSLDVLGRAVHSVTPWTFPTLYGGWEDYASFSGGTGYRLNGDWLEFTGTCRAGGLGSSNPIIILPAQYRPPETRLLTAFSGANALDLRVESNGHVYVNTSSSWVTLESARFRL